VTAFIQSMKNLTELMDITSAIKHIIFNIIKADNVDSICNGTGGASFSYPFKGATATGFYDYSFKGVKVRVRSISYLRDEMGVWIGHRDENNQEDRGESIERFYSRSELQKIINNKDQLTLF